jgi:tellurite resistance-related uncharacterized protein
VKRLPPDVVPYSRTPEFSESTVPAALRRHHTTKSGVWGRIHVVAGSLRYRILAPEPEEYILSRENVGVVEPEVPHEVEPLGKVRFYVEFFRRYTRRPDETMS